VDQEELDGEKDWMFMSMTMGQKEFEIVDGNLVRQ
jgi:hypothetical protein